MRVLLFARNQRMIMICGVIFFLMTAGVKPVYPESRVFKCTGASGQITFSQTGCKRGISESLVVKNPDVGWVNLEKVVSKFKTKSSNERNMQPKPEASRPRRGGDRAQKQRCWKARKKVARIERELMHGYKPARGEELRYQRLEQEEYIALFCKEPLP